MSSIIKFGKVKFYDPKKDFGFIRDLHVESYVEKRDDYYFSSWLADQENYASDEYVVLVLVPKGDKSSEWAVESVEALHSTTVSETVLLDTIASVPDPIERSAISKHIKLVRPWRLGRVRFFDHIKGFGFTCALRPISGDAESDLYMHESDVSGDVGDDYLVWFKAIPSRNRETGLQAASITRHVPSGEHTEAVVKELVSIEQEMIHSLPAKPLLESKTLANYLGALSDKATTVFISSLIATDGFAPFATVESWTGSSRKEASLIARLWSIVTEALDESSAEWSVLKSKLQGLLDKAYEQTEKADHDFWFSYWRRGWMSVFPVEEALKSVQEEGPPAVDKLNASQWIDLTEHVVPLLLASIRAAISDPASSTIKPYDVITRAALLLVRYEAAHEGALLDEMVAHERAEAHKKAWIRKQEKALHELVKSAFGAGVLSSYEVLQLNERGLCNVTLSFEMYDQMYADKRSNWRKALCKAPWDYVQHALDHLATPTLARGASASHDAAEFKWWINTLAERVAQRLPDNPSTGKVRRALLGGDPPNDDIKAAHQQLQELVAEHASPTELIELYRHGYTRHFPTAWVQDNISHIDQAVLEDVFERGSRRGDDLDVFALLNSLLKKIYTERNAIDAEPSADEFSGAIQVVGWVLQQAERFLEESQGPEQFRELVAEHASPTELLELYRHGYTRHFPTAWARDNISHIDQAVLEDVFKQGARWGDDLEVFELLNSLLEKVSLERDAFDAEPSEDEFSEAIQVVGWVLEQAGRFLEESQLDDLWRRFIERTSLAGLYILCLVREAHMWLFLLLDSRRFYQLFLIALQTVEVTSWTHHRSTVNRAYEALDEDLRDKLDDDLSTVSASLRPTVKLLRWLDGADTHVSVDFLSTALYTLEDTAQLTALRKLFHMHEQGQEIITPEVLHKLLGHHAGGGSGRARDRRPVAYPVEVVLRILARLYEGEELVSVRDLIEIARRNVEDNPTRRLSLEGIFNECEGRMEKNWDWKKQSGEIKEFKRGNRRFYQISFDYNPVLVEAVRKLPGRRYDSEKKVWICPADQKESKAAVERFASKYRFFIGKPNGRHFSNNPHFVELKRGQPPYGITFCEGRKAKKVDTETGYPFWWCRNQPCYQSCHGPNEAWESYTLTDFARILGLRWSGTDRDPNDPVDQRFMGYVNRVNQLLDKMYCHTCDHMLAPRTSSNYSHYRVTEFYCDTNGCSEKGATVYLHHCLNGRCRSIIDSRESKQCPNGWYICTNEKCGCCCSTETFERRATNLQRVGRPIPQALARNIREKRGHLERGEHFCYKCGSKMTDQKKEVFICPNDGVKYETSDMNFKREYRRLQGRGADKRQTYDPRSNVSGRKVGRVNDVRSGDYGSGGKSSGSKSSSSDHGQDPNWPPPIEAYE